MNYTIKNKLASTLSMAPLTDIGGTIIRLQGVGKKGSAVEVAEATRDNAILKRVEKLQWISVEPISPVVAAPAPVAKTAQTPLTPKPAAAKPVKVATPIKATAPESELVNPVVKAETPPTPKPAESVKTTESDKAVTPDDK
jgi:hypothetical protein